MTEVTFLSSDDVADLATARDYVDVIRAAYRERGHGAPAHPRTTLRSSDPPGKLTGYGAILPETGYMGGYTYAAGFAARDAWFVTPLFDAETGALRAILDGAAMNPYKTGATGALAVDVLARTDATRLGLIGSGSQARGQLLATATVRDLTEVRVFSPTRSHREAFAAEFDDRLDANVRSVDSPDETVTDCDIVTTATTAETPVFDGSLLAPGTHVTAMGQYHPQRREVDIETIARARYIPDLRERAFQDAGAFLMALEAERIEEDHIHAELGDVVAGTTPGRTSTDEITLFDSGGTAIETVSAAAMLFERALEADRGTTVEVSPASEAFLG